MCGYDMSEGYCVLLCCATEYLRVELSGSVMDGCCMYGFVKNFIVRIHKRRYENISGVVV